MYIEQLQSLDWVLHFFKKRLKVGRFMVFNATFNIISAILWRSVLLVEETGVPGENHWPVASHWQTLSHNAVSSTPHMGGIFELTTLMVIGTDCIGINPTIIRSRSQRERTDNIIIKRERTDNIIVKRERTDNIIVKRERTNMSFCFCINR